MKNCKGTCDRRFPPSAIDKLTIDGLLYLSCSNPLQLL